MENMESVGLREFRANLHKYTLEAVAPIELTSHGRRVGFYVPCVPKEPDKKTFATLMENAGKMEAALSESGYSEDELVAEFDRLRKEGRRNKNASENTPG